MNATEFQKLVHDYQAMVHKICLVYCDNKQDQEDLFQEIVYQLWRSIDGYRKEAKISTWIYKVALNTALNGFRKKRVAIEYHDELSQQLPSTEQTGFSDMDQIMLLMNGLNDIDKALLSLYLEGYSHKEMAEICGCSENNAAVKINRLKNKLKQTAGE